MAWLPDYGARITLLQRNLDALTEYIVGGELKMATQLAQIMDTIDGIKNTIAVLKETIAKNGEDVGLTKAEAQQVIGLLQGLVDPPVPAPEPEVVPVPEPPVEVQPPVEFKPGPDPA